MSWLRRRMMANVGGGEQYDADSYIQNGLVFQLDGIDKGNDATKWIDRKNGYYFPLSDSAIATIQHDGVYLTGAGYLNMNERWIGTPTWRNGTIEVSCDFFYNNAARVVFISAIYKGLSFGFLNNVNVIMAVQDSGVPTWSTPNNTNHRVWSCNNNVAVADIINPMTKNGTNAFTEQFTVPHIGGRSSNSNYYQGLVRAIRIYNRQLTLEEMQFNQRIDNVRFQLGIVE